MGIDENEVRWRITQIHRRIYYQSCAGTPVYDATGGPFTHSKISKYVELYTEDGIRGVCPCSSIMEKTILPLIMTGEKRSFAQWMHKVYWSCRNSGFDGETAGEVGKLEYLLTDILAKRAGMPFHRFLGALKDSVTVYGSGGSTHLSGAALAGEMEQFMDCGHKTVKMKVGTDFATKIDYDVERVRLVRETIGPDAELAIDGNHSFTAKRAACPFLPVRSLLRQGMMPWRNSWRSATSLCWTAWK